jgi:hypothetical protein
MSSIHSKYSEPVSKTERVSHIEKLNQHFDPAYSKSLVEQVIGPINDLYFKSRLVGFQQLPERNQPTIPLIFVSNHSGMAFPWDGMVFSSMLFKQQDFQMDHMVRTLAAPALSESNLMNPYQINNFWMINGAVDARFRNFETMMHHQHSNLLVYPEGVPGIGKGYNRRYQLQRFATSFIRMSIKYKTDIIPFSTVNGEYINPYVLSWPWLNKWSQKIGIPYIPVGFHTLLLIFLPWLFYYGLPARLTYVMGKRIKPYRMINKPYEDLSKDEIKAVRDQVKSQMQEELAAAVELHGRRRYSSKKLTGGIMNIFKLALYSPLGWPILFRKHHAQYKQSRGEPFILNTRLGSCLRFLISDPITVCYYIPVLGWIPLLIRGYRGNKIRSRK